MYVWPTKFALKLFMKIMSVSPISFVGTHEFTKSIEYTQVYIFLNAKRSLALCKLIRIATTHYRLYLHHLHHWLIIFVIIIKFCLYLLYIYAYGIRHIYYIWTNSAKFHAPMISQYYCKLKIFYMQWQCKTRYNMIVFVFTLLQIRMCFRTQASLQVFNSTIQWRNLS